MRMELRKDPITRSWVITGDDVPEAAPRVESCRFCPDSRDTPQIISTLTGGNGGPWSARAVVHPSPLYHIEGEPWRRGDGIYDRMRPIGAHEVLVENSIHDRYLWNASEAEIEQFLLLATQRIQDLKNDSRIKYVSIFKNHGANAGQEFPHPTSQLTATTFVPRRVLYELRAGREYFAQKERCVFCDIISQELQQGERMLEVRGDYVSLCPYAPRAPYETWILPRTHEASFERSGIARGGTFATWVH
jgi:UDPglucose--hexose-1-phosphate uridylyltransferase